MNRFAIPSRSARSNFTKRSRLGFGKLRTPRLLQTWVIVGIHVVEADDVVAISQETSRDVESNKSCRAGDQNRAVSHADDSLQLVHQNYMPITVIMRQRIRYLPNSSRLAVKGDNLRSDPLR